MQVDKSVLEPLLCTQPKALKLLRTETDRCVKCGLCLPECPTYRIYGSENESPRGRIALVEGIVSGQLPHDDAAQTHLDRCLLCRRCERVCPSQVRYGRLIDLARQTIAKPARRRALTEILRHPTWLGLASRVARTIPLALSRPLGRLHGMHRLGGALQSDRCAPDAGTYPTLTPQMLGRVGLFKGCATAALQGGALQDALLLLRRAGLDVLIPSDNICCGALDQHAGEHDRADELAQRNRMAFAGELDAVVSIASGCGIHIDGYQPPMTAPHRDICRVLLEIGTLSPAMFRPLDDPVMLHVPCSVENVYRGAAWARHLLMLIPGVEILPLGEAGQCCGAAGDYMLRHPDAAQQLRRPIIDAIADARAAILVSSNIGCAMHIADGLTATRQIEVLHPVELLARQLEPGPQT